jgi:hypothetical protein
MMTSRKKAEELEEKLVQCHFVHLKSHVDLLGNERGPPR